MNVHMYENTATQKNIEICKSYDIHFVEPIDGPMACGYSGKGHIANLDDIVECIDYMTSSHPLKGKHILILSLIHLTLPTILRV